MGNSSLLQDPLLETAPTVAGYKVLGGVVLYEKIGRGAMGAVYKGRHLRLNIDVAVKVMALPQEVSAMTSARFVRRFVREAQTAAQIDHQNLIRVIDVNAEAGVHYLVMQFVDGESAATRLRRKGSLPEAEAVQISRGAARGIGHAHKKGIVHRDVKPDNIMIAHDGEVKVTDLGLAKAYSDPEQDTGDTGLDLTASQAAIGTPLFMSPEQTRSARDVDPRSDVWSLGVTMFQLLTDELPFNDTDFSDLVQRIRADPAPDIKTIRPDLSDEVCAIIHKCLEKDPDRRYTDGEDLSAELAGRFQDGGATLLRDPAAKTTQALSIKPPSPDVLAKIAQEQPQSPPKARQRGVSPSNQVTLVAESDVPVSIPLDKLVERRLEVQQKRRAYRRGKWKGEAEVVEQIDRDLAVAREIEAQDAAAAYERFEQAIRKLDILRQRAEAAEHEDWKLVETFDPDGGKSVEELLAAGDARLRAGELDEAAATYQEALPRYNASREKALKLRDEQERINDEIAKLRERAAEDPMLETLDPGGFARLEKLFQEAAATLQQGDIEAGRAACEYAAQLLKHALNDLGPRRQKHGTLLARCTQILRRIDNASMKIFAPNKFAEARRLVGAADDAMECNDFFQAEALLNQVAEQIDQLEKDAQRKHAAPRGTLARLIKFLFVLVLLLVLIGGGVTAVHVFIYPIPELEQIPHVGPELRKLRERYGAQRIWPR